MASARTGSVLKRALAALGILAALAVAAAAVLVLYAGSRLARAESRHLGELRARLVAPPPSSAESLDYTERFLAAAVQVAAAWPEGGLRLDPDEPRVPAELSRQVEVLLGAAEVPLAHEPLRLADEQGLGLLRVARLLDGVAAEAAARGDDQRQTRSAAALSAIATALHQRTSVVGMLLGSAVEQLELGVVQRLVEDPATSPEAIARCAALLAEPPPPIHASFAGEALELLAFELPSEDHGWAAPLIVPLENATGDLLKARTLERFGEFAGELDRPLDEMLASRPALSAPEGPFDTLAAIVLPNTRDAFVKAKTTEVVRDLGREAVAARQEGVGAELTRPEIVAALERYWDLAAGETPPPGLARTRALLTWRVPG